MNGTAPWIDLDSGGTAFYNGGAGTSVLSFTYIVAEAESSDDLDIAVNSTDVTSTASISIPIGGAIFDESSPSSPAVVTLPKPGVEGSLSSGADISIDSE